LARFYQVMIEGVFVRAPVFYDDVGGFQSTFFVGPGGLSDAIADSQSLLMHRMKVHEVLVNEAGVLRTYFLVSDAWEVSEERARAGKGGDHGFTFFQIGVMDRIYQISRRLMLEKIRPAVLLPMRSG